MILHRILPPFGFALCAAAPAFPGWGTPPAGWDDFRFGLVHDGKPLYTERMKAGVAGGAKLEYRYTYLNNGVLNKADTAGNAYSWLFSPWKDYAKESQDIGVKSAFVLYMLQEDQGPAHLTMAANANDPVFMRNYLTTLKRVAERTAGRKPVFVLEPDTWGYILQAGVDPTSAKAVVNSLGGEFAYLADLPNTYSGLARALIRTVKRFAPDGYAGVLMSHWTPDSHQCEPPDGPDSQMGLPWRTPDDIDCAADRNIAFANKLLGPPGGPDRGDFIGVEKNGHSAGYWAALAGNQAAFSRRYYWDDARNANWLRWCARLGKGVDLPLLAWQIAIGHMGLPNACLPGPLSPSSGLGVESGNCAFEDTFMPYFFAHPKDFMAAGFIGMLAGKGLGDDTDFTHPDKDPGMGDKGWFFGQLGEFDKGRPWLKGSTGTRGRTKAARPAAGKALVDAHGRERDPAGRAIGAGDPARP